MSTCFCSQMCIPANICWCKHLLSWSSHWVRQHSSIFSPSQHRESWWQGHQKASSSPASVCLFLSLPVHSSFFLLPHPFSPPPVHGQESRCHLIPLPSQSPSCSDPRCHLLSPAEPQTATSHHLHRLWQLIVYADCWTPYFTGPLFWSCYGVFTFSPSLSLETVGCWVRSVSCREGGAPRSICVSKVLFLPTSAPEEMEGKIFLIIYSQRKSLIPGALSLSFLYPTSGFNVCVWR